ncbi:MAG: hypothetical protein IJ684_04050 [Bacteroidales bacterium]|nr:hypothetical protein [Bacteroidales bacterium]
MTEREILDRQEQTGNQQFLLVLVGSFLHAYGNGAFALARVTGYRVRRKQRKWGEVLVVGFPIAQLDLVRQQLRDAGADVEQVDDKTFLFRGIDGTPDPQMVVEPARTGGQTPCATPRTEGLSPCAEAESWLAEAVKGFNLSLSTPMDAMLFIGTLQQEISQRESRSVQ